jgi:hypothetical protein
MTLYEMSEANTRLLTMLEDGEIDEQTLNDTLESMGIEDKLEDYCKVINQLNADAIMVDAEIKRLKSKKERIDKNVDRMNGNLLNYFHAANKENEKAGTFTVAIRKTQSVEITNIDLLPCEYIRTKTVIEPDKLNLKTALKLGDVPGAEIRINETVTIK